MNPKPLTKEARLEREAIVKWLYDQQMYCYNGSHISPAQAARAIKEGKHLKNLKGFLT